MKKITFLGGGSLRILPIVRGVLSESPDIMEDGEIRLLDLNLERAEAVARMIRACPEWHNVNCKVIATNDTDSALEGIDILYLTMAALREPSESKSLFLAKEYDYIWSDQLSINGAFLVLRLGGLVYSLAKKLEKLSPDALMLIFPNPVSVYSNIVNCYTKIRALGVCGGFINHRWDLSRLCGRNCFDPDWNVVAAGVNHCSFILRGEYKGEDLYSQVMPRVLTDSWQCMDFRPYSEVPELLEVVLKNLYTMYRKHGIMIFSSESDGTGHIFKKSADMHMDLRMARRSRDYDAQTQKSMDTINRKFADFIELSKHPEQVNWNVTADENEQIGPAVTDITIPILKALAGKEPMRIVASRPNYGAVKGMPEMAALEYSMDIFKDTITPVEDLYIPAPFKGLVASLSEFQTLQADAIAQQDPALFAAALDAYPVGQFKSTRIEYFRKMFDIYDDLDPIWRKSLDYLL